MKHYTTIEQSKKLVELGLNPNTADMCYIQTPADEYRLTAYNLEYCNNLKQQKGSDMNLIPCWSLGALLEVMPKCIVVDGKNYFSYIATLDTISYGDTDGSTIIKFTSNTLEAAYNMIVWLLENNYIKTEKK